MKNLVLVLGMHRSGTSMLTGVLNILGLPLGDNLMSATVWNPKGYFENTDFVKHHQKILNNCNSSWCDVNVDDELLLTEENIGILNSILDVYNDYEIFALKDPRVCLLLPLYEKVCKNRGINLLKIHIKRDNDSIISSLKNRDNLFGGDVTKIQNLIDEYVNRVTNPNIVLSYMDIINNPKDNIKILLNNISYLSSNKIDEAINFIDKNLNRN